MADSIKADRRLALTADRSRMVDAGDPEARYLLAEVGQVIPPAEIKRLSLSLKDGKVVQGAAEPSAAKEPAAERTSKSGVRRRKKGKA